MYKEGSKAQRGCCAPPLHHLCPPLPNQRSLNVRETMMNSLIMIRHSVRVSDLIKYFCFYESNSNDAAEYIQSQCCTPDYMGTPERPNTSTPFLKARFSPMEREEITKLGAIWFGTPHRPSDELSRRQTPQSSQKSHRVNKNIRFFISLSHFTCIVYMYIYLHLHGQTTIS